MLEYRLIYKLYSIINNQIYTEIYYIILLNIPRNPLDSFRNLPFFTYSLFLITLEPADLPFCQGVTQVCGKEILE